MSEGVIIHLDDKQEQLDQYIGLYNQMDVGLEYISCTNIDDFLKRIEENTGRIKSLIFDLVGSKASKDELEGDSPEFLETIEQNFISINVPIFIYSGVIEKIRDRYNENGTVFKLSKDNSINEIYTKIKLLNDSGFIEVFSPGGLLEKQVYIDLHKAFTKQFLSNVEIENIINNLNQDADFKKSSARIKKVFQRIALRSLLSEMLLPDIDEKGAVIEETLNPVEHYIRRIGDLPVWTGDIFKKKDSDDCVFVLTPRCNVLRSSTILVCPFMWKDIITKKDKISKMLQGDPTVSGYDRHIPPSPIFEGGKLSLSKYWIVEKETLINDYTRIITLSDELTNEILGKFGAHFFRTGITPWDPNEVIQITNGEK